MNPENIRQFFQTYYYNNTNNPLQFESRGQYSIQIVSAAMDKDMAQQAANKIKIILPLSDAQIVPSRNVHGQFRAIIYNPEDVVASFLKHEEKMRLFFQTLYNKNTGNNFQFDLRAYDGSKHVIRVVSPVMNAQNAQQVVNNLKKLLPESAQVGMVSSQKEPSQFRAIINNTEDVFTIYLKQMIERLNKAHPIPSDAAHFGLTHTWTNPRDTNIAYKTYVASQYHSDLVDPKFRKNLLRKIYEYHAQLETRYPGLKILVISHKHGAEYLIPSFTYEHYESLQRTLNQRSLKELGMTFFRNNQDLYHKVKQELNVDLKDDIGIEYVDYNFNLNSNEDTDSEKDIDMQDEVYSSPGKI